MRHKTLYKLIAWYWSMSVGYELNHVEITSDTIALGLVDYYGNRLLGRLPFRQVSRHPRQNNKIGELRIVHGDNLSLEVLNAQGEILLVLSDYTGDPANYLPNYL